MMALASHDPGNLTMTEPGKNGGSADEAMDSSQPHGDDVTGGEKPAGNGSGSIAPGTEPGSALAKGMEAAGRPGSSPKPRSRKRSEAQLEAVPENEREKDGETGSSGKRRGKSQVSRKKAKQSKEKSETAKGGKEADGADKVEDGTQEPAGVADGNATLGRDSASPSSSEGNGDSKGKVSARQGGTKARAPRTATRRSKAADASQADGSEDGGTGSGDARIGTESKVEGESDSIRFSCPIEPLDRVVVRAKAIGIDMTKPEGMEMMRRVLGYANWFLGLPDGKPGRRVRRFMSEYDGILGPGHTVQIDMMDEIDLADFVTALNLDIGDVSLFQYDTGEWVAPPFDAPWPKNMLEAMQSMSGYPPMRMQLAMTLAPAGVPRMGGDPCIGVSSVIVKCHEGRVMERVEKCAYTMDALLADDAYDQFRSEMLFTDGIGLLGKAVTELVRPDKARGMTGGVVIIDDMSDTMLGTVLLKDAHNGEDRLRGDAVVIGTPPETRHLEGRWLLRTVSPYAMRIDAPDGEGISVTRYVSYDDRDERGRMLRRLRRPVDTGDPADARVVEVAMFEREESKTDGNGAPLWRLMFAFLRKADRLEALDGMSSGQRKVPIGELVVVD